MKATHWLLLFVVACMLPALAHAEEKKSEAPPPPKEESITGTLMPSSGQGLGQLKEDQTDKKVPAKTYVLWAEGDVAKQLTDLVKAKAHVEITGVKATDGTNNVKVTKVTEEKKTPGKKKP
ncbi:MAG: hypothetical protein HY291_02260 [Planctomycetes bacterium]|nr:hypothetical protein [Planctomycetota bacterium]